MFDLNLVPLSFVDGQEQAEMPELYGASSPRRAARARAQEQLVLFLVMQGSAPFSPTGMRQLLERLAQEYFQASGSVTAALHGVVEAMNTYLLEHNMHNASVGRQAMGNLSLAAFHGDKLYLAQSGAAHAYLIGSQPVQHFSEPGMANRGLGLTTTPAIRYYQAELAAGQYLALCANPPVSWNAAALSSTPPGSLEAMRRRLLSQAPANLAAALVQITPGSGKTNLVVPVIRSAAAPSPEGQAQRSRPSPAQPVTPATEIPPAMETAPAVPLATTAAAPAPQPAQSTLPPETTPLAPAPTTIPPPAPSATTPTVPTESPAALPQSNEPVVARPVTPSSPAVPSPSRTQPRHSFSRSGRAQPGRVVRPAAGPEGEPIIQEIHRRRNTSTFLSSMGAFLRGARAFRQRAGNAMRTFTARLLPGSSESLPALSNATMIFIAIAVPVIIVAVALVVYNEKGRGDYYRLYYAQAQLSASQVSGMKDDNPQDDAALRNAWNDVLMQLDKAEVYQKTADSLALRRQVWDALDKLDELERLDFVPITGSGLGQGVHISRMVAMGNELYMLDSSHGRVLHAIQTSRGYDIDPTFACLPGGTTDQSPATRLVDIAALPVGNYFNAELAVVDETGGFVYCAPGKPATSFQLVPPETNWGKITAITLDSKILYVLEPQVNEIYYYEPDDQGTYSNPPNKLFDTPPSLGDSIDMAVNGNRVYILHSDGHLTDCTIYNVDTTPMRCTSPAVFSEFRKNKTPNPTTFPGTNFTHILYTSPPDPSIYLMDANASTIYLFSVQLNLRRLFSAPIDVILSQSNPQATAFTINKSNRTAFLAWGDQVYYASVP